MRTIAAVGLILFWGWLSPVSAQSLPAGIGDEHPFANLLISPPLKVLNVILPQFGDRIGGGDYGMANVEPLEVARGDGREPEIRIVRDRQELRLSRRGHARFKVLLGQTRQVYYWLDSRALRGTWTVNVGILDPDGFRKTILSQDWLPDVIYFSFVPPHSVLEFRVGSKLHGLAASKRFTFTVSPVDISVWKNFRPVPTTIERGVIPY